jgi:signal transduction histidine kinase
MTSRTTRNNVGAKETATETLDRLERIFAEHPVPAAPDLIELCATARRGALAILSPDGSQSAAEDVRAALLFYTADLLSALAIELSTHREPATELIAELTDAAALSRTELAREVLRDPALLGFPPAVAIEVQLGLLMAFAPLRDVSIWMTDEGGAVHCVSRVRDGSPGAGEQELAERLIGAGARTAEQDALIGFAIKRWEERAAALIARPEQGRHADCATVLEHAIASLGAILERERLIARSVAAERTLTQTHERRLARLGFDIHDGPLQDLSLLGEDVRLLRHQLSDVLAPDVKDIVLGRLDDLDAQMVALDSALRRISASLQSPLMGAQSIPEALAKITRAFAARSGVEPELTVEGNLEDLTDSQQMALLSIVREALSNVREHSQASEVRVSVAGRPMSIELQVVDNGSGFDVEKALVQAARDGRFGLIGLHQRARLLGGCSSIDSGPGRPTTISATLPRWRPVAPESE